MDPPAKWVGALEEHAEHATLIRVLWRVGSGAKFELGSWKVTACRVDVLDELGQTVNEGHRHYAGYELHNGEDLSVPQFVQHLARCVRLQFLSKKREYQARGKSLKAMEFWLSLKKDKEELCVPIYHREVDSNSLDAYGFDATPDDTYDHVLASLGPAAILLDRQARMNLAMLNSSAEREKQLAETNIRLANALTGVAERTEGAFGSAQNIFHMSVDTMRAALEQERRVGGFNHQEEQFNRGMESFLSGLGKGIGESVGGKAGEVLRDIFGGAEPQDERAARARACMQRAGALIDQGVGGWWDELIAPTPDAWEDLRTYFAQGDHSSIEAIQAALEHLAQGIATPDLQDRVNRICPLEFKKEMESLYRLTT